MYVFGGSSGSAMNDLFELQIPANASLPGKWKPVHTSTARADQPQPRFCHVAVIYQESLYAFGGKIFAALMFSQVFVFYFSLT
jgi:hypothetical protein